MIGSFFAIFGIEKMLNFKTWDTRLRGIGNYDRILYIDRGNYARQLVR